MIEHGTTAEASETKAAAHNTHSVLGNPNTPDVVLPKTRLGLAGRKILCKRFSTKSRMALESRADSGLNPLITESHGGQSGMRAGTA